MITCLRDLTRWLHPVIYQKASFLCEVNIHLRFDALLYQKDHQVSK
jgi:hypothetical protein